MKLRCLVGDDAHHSPLSIEGYPQSGQIKQLSWLKLILRLSNVYITPV